MTDRELMQQALEALAEWKEVFPDNWDAFDEHVFTALRERLAQPEQEPSGWTDENFSDLYVSEDIAADMGATVELYTSQPQRTWVEPTEKEIRKLIPPTDVWKYEVGHDEALKLIKSALNLAKEKNT